MIVRLSIIITREGFGMNQNNIKSSAASDTIFWMTDPQYYCSRPHIMDNYQIITEYAKKLYQDGEIGYVINTGDLVDEWNNDKQWRIADKAQRVLDDADVPNGVVSGNHDVSSFKSKNPFDHRFYQKYFSRARYQKKHWWGGDLHNNTHHYDLITIAGHEFIVMYLGMGLERKLETVTWANKVLEQYRDRKAILCLHEYLTKFGDYTGTHTGGDGAEVYELIVKNNKNIFLVLCEHEPGAAHRVKDEGGRRLIEILSCYQGDENNGGNGFIRLLKFSDGKLHNITYSPVLDQYNCFEKEKDEFEIELDWL